MTFWKTASKAQKLAQIDAGIELGMTARQVAINLGCSPKTIFLFAGENERSFKGYKLTPVQREVKLHGVRRRLTSDNTHMPEAFDIFGVKESKWEMDL